MHFNVWKSLFASSLTLNVHITKSDALAILKFLRDYRLIKKYFHTAQFIFLKFSFFSGIFSLRLIKILKRVLQNAVF